MEKKGFVLRKGEKGAILGGNKTALTKFRKLFLPQILLSFYNVSVFWNAGAFGFHTILLKKLKSLS